MYHFYSQKTTTTTLNNHKEKNILSYSHYQILVDPTQYVNLYSKTM